MTMEPPIGSTWICLLAMMVHRRASDFMKTQLSRELFSRFEGSTSQEERRGEEMMNRVFRLLAPLTASVIFVTCAFGQEAPPPPPDPVAQQLMAQQGPEGPGPGGPGPGGRGPGGPGFRRMELLGFGGFHGGRVVTG